jgi:hypothetical protein
MVMGNAFHWQTNLVMVYQLRVARTCSLTRRMEDSQLLSLKYGQLQRWNNDENEKENGHSERERKNRDKKEKERQREH